jgi:aminopeptidase YwaD
MPKRGGVPMAKSRIYLAIVAILVLAAAPASFVKAETKFSGNEAYRHVVALSTNIGARPAGSENSRRAAEYIANQFKSYGLETRFQEFKGKSVWNGKEIADRNVVAILRGSSASRMIIVGGHFDSVAESPGANDNASGTAVMLELARILSKTRPAATIVFVAFGAEEDGLIGSYAYASGLNPLTVSAMINIDMAGVGETLWISNSKGENFLTRLALEKARLLGIAAKYEPSGDSDHVSFEERGIPSLFLNRPDDDEIHTPNDKADRVKPELLKAVGEIALAVIIELAK